MNKHPSSYAWFNLVAACVLAIGVAGCSGDDGAPGAAGVPGPGVAPLASSTALNFTITGVSIGSAPVVNFSVTNQDGVAVAGFADTDLRFNIAKLIPGSPSKWQNYINRASGGAVQGTQERVGTGYAWGTLVDYKNGTYTYTFATDITNAAANPCPAPCADADGNALDVSYQPSLTHRVGIQQNNTALPKANAIYDFVPAGGAVSTTREIASTTKCNECHNKLSAHGGGMRIDSKLCVTCHNPGSWVNTTGNVQTVDFKVMIHKIHHGDELPSVLDPDGTPATTTKGTYAIGTHDFSDVAFPQDIRNCTKCHDGTVGAANATTNGDNWKTMPSKAACASCHDDVYFGATAAKPYQVVSHMALITNAGGVAIADPADSLCLTCHASGQLAGSIEDKHAYPALLKTEGAKYQFNILAICGTAVASNPTCAPAVTPTIQFSVTNPVAGTTYDILNDVAFKCVTSVGLPASMSVLVGWNNTDENNTGSASNPGQPYTASVLETYTSATGACSANANVVANGGNTFTVTLTGKTIPAVTGSGRAVLYGRISKDVDGNGTKENVRIKATYKDFAITDATPVARRKVVDIAKCDKCHDQLSLHGDSRTDEPGLCVMCHNPSATDVNRRPKIATGLPGAGFPNASATLDGKTEETIDFKRMIHSIHAAAKTLYPVAPATVGATANGFRNKGLVIYGFNSSINDFSHIRFPGILNDCLTCHVTPTGTNPGTYELTGKWEVPTLSGILGSSISTVPDPTGVSGTYAQQLANQADDLNITPTAAVCSACHDGQVAQSHMQLNGALFSATQATINTGATLEACAICHGPGRTADVKLVHGVK